ncbi:hypothetical protein [Salmonella enterica]|uniref:hypothetical protein n=1 Tax=Salmonella enterica TaxID=28901 RepID=UPI001124F7E4|nr:hypothetical protein [Salmonella enterica]
MSSFTICLLAIPGITPRHCSRLLKRYHQSDDDHSEIIHLSLTVLNHDYITGNSGVARKTRAYSVRVRTAHGGEYNYNMPVPGASKVHVASEMNSPDMAVLDVQYLYWCDIQLIGYASGDYFFKLITKSGREFIYGPGDFGWGYLNFQFHKNVNEMTDEIERNLGYYDDQE